MDNLPRFPTVDMPAFAAASAESAMRFLVDELVQRAGIQSEAKEEIVARLLRREKLGSTGIGRGVAFPHCVCEKVEKIAGVIGRSEMEVPWPGKADDVPVRRVCLFVSRSRNGEHLRVLEAVSRMLLWVGGVRKGSPLAMTTSIPFVPITTPDEGDDLQPEYDLNSLKEGVRGKYFERYQSGTNLALLAPDIRAAFPTDAAVNDALRSLMNSQPQAPMANG